MLSRSWLAAQEAPLHRDGEAADSSDAALLERLRRDDGAALHLILQRYWAPLVAYLARLLDSRDLAEDVAQRTCCQLWERRFKWRREGSLRGLLFRVARNYAISERRRRGVELRSATQEATVPARNPTPVDVLESHQLRAALEGAIGQLPERRREVFVLRCVHGLSYKEIAGVMSISTQTVANQLTLALSALRRDLADLLDD